MPVLLDKSSAPKLIEKFIFVGSDKLEQFLDIRKSQRLNIRQELPEGLYWCRCGRKVFWNWHLIRDWFLNGGDRTTPQHQKIVEEFLKTMPQNKSA